MMTFDTPAHAACPARRPPLSIGARPAVFVLLTAVLTAARPSIAADDSAAIYVMRPDGSQVRQVAKVVGFLHATSPRWSHDGKRAAFDAWSVERKNRAVFVVNIDGTGLRELPGNARPDWSPDDKQLAFDRYSNGPSRVHVQNLDGEGDAQIAEGVCARWSPDGSQMAVTNHSMIYVIDLVSGEEKPLFNSPSRELFGGFNWSPDGKWIALSARREFQKPRQLLLVSTQGADHGLRVRFQSEQGGSITFSPDGKRIAFDNGYKIFIAEVDSTTEPQMVEPQEGKNQDPHWSPDGQWILFSSDR